MLTTLNYAESATGLTGENAVNLASGLFASIERACNRVFARVIESIDVVDGGDSVEVCQYRHRMKPGDKVSLASTSRSSDLDIVGAVILSEGFGRDQYRIAAPEGVTIAAEDIDGVDFYSRPHWTEIRRTRKGSTSAFVQKLPLMEVVKLSVPDGDGGWEEVLAEDYLIAGVMQGEASITGEVSLVSSTFSGAFNGDLYHPAGVQIEYVAGEPEPPEDAIYAMREILKVATRRNKQSDIQSESYDYYSYSRLSADQIGTLFGEAERIIRELRIPA